MMFLSFKNLLLIVTFNHCCGASHLIPTAIRSPPMAQPYVARGHAAPNHYPLYEMPFNYDPHRGELQYAASFAQSVLVPQVVNGQPQMVPQAAQVAQASQVQRQVQHGSTTGPVADGSNTRASVDANSAQRPRGVYEQQRLAALQREPKRLPVIRLKEGQQFPSQVVSKQDKSQIHLQKPVMPVLLRAEQTASTLQPMLNHENLKPNFAIRSRAVMRVPKMEMEPKGNLTEPNPRVHSIGFNWPKANRKSEGLDNSTYTSQSQVSAKQVKQLRTLSNEATAKLRQIVNDQSHGEGQSQVPMVAHKLPKVKYPESQPNVRFDATESPYQMPSVETELYRETYGPTTASPIETTTLWVENPRFESYVKEDEYNATKEVSGQAEQRMDKKESLSSVDSELSYQTQYYDPQKPMNHFEASLPNNDQIVSYEPPVQSPDALPENEVSYANPEAESLSVAVPEDVDYDENDKGLSDENGPKLKILLEQFIQQLDVLKFVAAKELQKSGVAEEYSNYESPSPKDGEVIRTTVAEPSVSSRGQTYDDYQNQRSFEQNYSNSDSKAYKDTHEKNYGRKPPCKKPFHLGAMPNLAQQYSRA